MRGLAAPDMLRPRVSARATVLNGELYVVGGSPPLAKVSYSTAISSFALLSNSFALLSISSVLLPCVLTLWANGKHDVALRGARA